MEDVTTSPSYVDKASKLRISKETLEPNNTTDQWASQTSNRYLLNYWKCIFFSVARGALFKITPQAAKQGLANKEVILCILMIQTIHNECINRYQEKLRTYINTWKLNNPLLNEQMGH